MDGRLARVGAVLLLACWPLAAAGPPFELVQPTVVRDGTVLRTGPGRALIQADGARTRGVPLRSNEQLTTVAETRGGWTAAGLRTRDSAVELFLVRDGQRGLERLAAPGSQRHALRLRPVLLVLQEDLEGLAWLEGDDAGSLAVRAALRSDGEWGATSVVAPPARGSQTGLSGAVLADGSWLLVWSAFDGKDDEIMWSRAFGDRWSPPRRLAVNNQVPDITPNLVATRDGALVVWSRPVDGDYRLLLSRFSGTDWTPPARVGPPGSVEARFVGWHDRLLLVYQHAWPQAWAVVELDRRGRVARWTALAGPTGSRPVIATASKYSVELQWPGVERRSAGWERVP